ncbi:biotin--[acetyl-CoA-carboxylase] ligase [uncultured Flavobacterium sp.]|uniref:biotin--[acetyl-CoA-carboxylase] ligase n=1 Tax=uncultured Flavobacterium sp. TaxID=165435 RepID=UPI0025E8390F|nr:biotin--[acetyl-CoA-carboxylase] ligase [uncultured Flavobacterium sp.]
MNIIKLNAITSTNDYLKSLVAKRYVENLTVVSAESQTQGKGQMGAKWDAEPGKNLTFSVLVKDLLLEIGEIFSLNAAVAVSIAGALERIAKNEISIKWPNDILAGNYKIGGVLIENIIRNNGEIHSVIGIGLNVNQKDFSGLPKASSLSVMEGGDFDKEAIMVAILENLKRNISRILNKDIDAIWQVYHARLYKKDVPMPFEKEGNRFMGIIRAVSQDGHLLVQMEDDNIVPFGLKEVALLY